MPKVRHNPDTRYLPQDALAVECHTLDSDYSIITGDIVFKLDYGVLSQW